MNLPVDLQSILPGTRHRTAAGCGCEASFDGSTLVLDASGCLTAGSLVDGAPCRASVVDALAHETVQRIAVRSGGWERVYGDDAVDLFCAAGRFATAIRAVDDRLAARTCRDPLGAATEATGRADATDLAADTGLAQFGDGSRAYEGLLTPRVGPTLSSWRVDPQPPADSSLERVKTLETRASVRIYETPGRRPRCYHLEPEELGFDVATTRRLRDAHASLAETHVGGGYGAPGRAVRTVADETAPRAAMARVLRKHTHEPGLLRDFFADDDLSDVYVTAPAPRNPVRVTVGGETMDTNVTITPDGVAALASRFRRESGRGFSRAAPTLDTATDVADRRVRVAGVTKPVSEGHAFAFRAHSEAVWTLPGLVGNGTLSARAAGLLSLAVERGAATLLAGPRASGKTTLLGALLWEVPPSVRTIVIEDAPELPVKALQSARRDVQALRGDVDSVVSPAEAVRAALRLGDGALVVGEVRGEEAGALYEAMRVGANSEAVLGTIHGDGAAAVLERVVSDLGVPASAFAATDLLVTLETTAADRTPRRRVRTIEEVGPADPVTFAPLFEQCGDGLEATGRIQRGNSRLVARLTDPAHTYADTLTALSDRTAHLDRLVATESPEPVAVARNPGASP